MSYTYSRERKNSLDGRVGAAIIPILYNMWRALPGLELGNSRTRKTLGLYDREIGWVGKGRMKGKGNNCINKGMRTPRKKGARDGADLLVGTGCRISK